MLKKIRTEQLRIGMFIKEFCGSWMEHPFWRASFLLENNKDLAEIQASSITEVWIDISKGLDVKRGGPGENAEDVAARVEEDLREAAAGKHQVEKVPLAQEMMRAAKIYAKSKEAVFSLFQEARLGRAINTEGARAMVEEISQSVLRNPAALISLARIKTVDEYTYLHSVAVCALMIALARQLGLDEDDTREAGVAGLLHDLGKAKIPLEILNKPGRLTEAEFTIIKTHPAEGHQMLVEGYGVGAAGAWAVGSR